MLEDLPLMYFSHYVCDDEQEGNRLLNLSCIQDYSFVDDHDLLDGHCIEDIVVCDYYYVLEFGYSAVVHCRYYMARNCCCILLLFVLLEVEDEISVLVTSSTEDESEFLKSSFPSNRSATPRNKILHVISIPRKKHRIAVSTPSK